MKKFIQVCFLISIYMLCAENASAQYKSIFGEGSTKWVVIPKAFCDIDFEVTFENEAHYENDTINVLIYKQVLSLQNQMQQVKDYLREDTLTGRVWHRPAEDSMEYLVMDLSLTVGDTFKVINESGKFSTFIADSVFYLEGLKHIRFNKGITFCGPIGENLTFIEGVGTNAGIFYGRKWGNPEHPNSYLLCLYKDDIKVAGNKR